MDGFQQGAGSVFRGFAYLCRHPALWRYGVLPMLLNLVITTVVLVGALAGVITGLVALHDSYPDGWEYVVLEWLVAVVVVALTLAAALFLWKVLEGILCGIFYERLARQVELQLGTPEGALQDIPFKEHVVDSIRDALVLLSVNVGFLALNLIPVVGSVVAMIGTFYYDWWLFGTEYLDYPLALRGMRSAEKKAFAKTHQGQTLGLGAVVMLFGFIPVVGPVILTTAVVGGVLLFHELSGGSGKAVLARSTGVG